MKVYRIAHESLTYNGFPSGPYRSDGLTPKVHDAVREMGFAHSWNDTHPSPSYCEKLNFIAFGERCGFDSLEALYEWFAGFLRTLHQAGFRIYTYDVPDEEVRVGTYGQVCFWTDSAELVSVAELEHEREAVPA